MTKTQRKWLLRLRRSDTDGLLPADKSAAFKTRKSCEARGWSETVKGKFGFPVVRITEAGRLALAEQEGDSK